MSSGMGVCNVSAVAGGIGIQVAILKGNAKRCDSTEARDRIKVACVTSTMIATAIKEDDPRFDMVTFMQACGFNLDADFRFYPADKDDPEDNELVVAIL